MRIVLLVAALLLAGCASAPAPVATHAPRPTTILDDTYAFPAEARIRESRTFQVAEGFSEASLHLECFSTSTGLGGDWKVTVEEPTGSVTMGMGYVFHLSGTDCGGSGKGSMGASDLGGTWTVRYEGTGGDRVHLWVVAT